MARIQTNKDLKTFFILLLFSFLLLSFDHFQLLKPVKAYSEKLFLPPKKAIYQNWQTVIDRVRDRARAKDSGERRELEEKIEKLEQEITILNAQYSTLNTQYSAARRLLGTPLPAEWQFIPGQAAGLIEGILAINKGGTDGIKVGQVALVEDIFVGKVERVGQHQSWVRLPIAQNSKLLAKVIPAKKDTTNADLAKAKGLLVGYGDKIKLEKVLLEEMLSEGDLVVADEFPPNLVIGKITKVEKKDVEVYQEAEVEPILDYQKLEIVFLLK